MAAKTQRHFWLIKSESDVYPLEQLRKDGSTAWTGVRNYEARNFMRDGMHDGDGVLFYHSNLKPSSIVGVAEVCSTPHPDPTQFDAKSEYFDPKSTRENPRWILVDIKYVKAFARPVALPEIKRTRGLENMMLLKRGRLSVQPVTREEWEIVQRLANG